MLKIYVVKLVCATSMEVGKVFIENKQKTVGFC